MSYAFYKLESQDHTTFIISDGWPEHNCQVTQMKPRGEEKSAILYRNIFTSYEGVGHRDHYKSVFEYKGDEYTSQQSLASAMGLTLGGLSSGLKRWRTWKSPWPDDLFELVCGKRLPHLRFVKKFRRYKLYKDPNVLPAQA